MPYPTLKRQEELNPNFLCPTTYFNVTEAVVLCYSKTFYLLRHALKRVRYWFHTHTHTHTNTHKSWWCFVLGMGKRLRKNKFVGVARSPLSQQSFWIKSYSAN